MKTISYNHKHDVLQSSQLSNLWYHVFKVLVARSRFTNDLLPAIQLRWKIHLTVISLLAIRSQQMFAHATTAQLSCHVQHYVAITVLEPRWGWNDMSNNSDSDGKKRQGKGACSCHKVHLLLCWHIELRSKHAQYVCGMTCKLTDLIFTSA